MNNIGPSFCLLCCFCGVTATSSAEVYKCVDEKGHTTYSGIPCASTSEKIQNDIQEGASGQRNANAGPEKNVNNNDKKTKSAWGGYIDRARKAGDQ